MLRSSRGAGARAWSNALVCSSTSGALDNTALAAVASCVSWNLQCQSRGVSVGGALKFAAEPSRGSAASASTRALSTRAGAGASTSTPSTPSTSAASRTTAAAAVSPWAAAVAGAASESAAANSRRSISTLQGPTRQSRASTPVSVSVSHPADAPAHDSEHFSTLINRAEDDAASWASVDMGAVNHFRVEVRPGRCCPPRHPTHSNACFSDELALASHDVTCNIRLT